MALFLRTATASPQGGERNSGTSGESDSQDPHIVPMMDRGDNPGRSDSYSEKPIRLAARSTPSKSSLASAASDDADALWLEEPGPFKSLRISCRSTWRTLIAQMSQS